VSDDNLPVTRREFDRYTRSTDRALERFDREVDRVAEQHATDMRFLAQQREEDQRQAAEGSQHGREWTWSLRLAAATIAVALAGVYVELINHH